MKLIYVAHPLGQGADRKSNRTSASLWCGIIGEMGFAPVADWIILSGVWWEDGRLREIGLAIDFALIERCDELWMLGPRTSPGMVLEKEHAFARGIVVRDFTRMSAIEVRHALARAT